MTKSTLKNESGRAKKGIIDHRELNRGDVVAVEWHDVISMEHIEFGEVKEMEEPVATRCWGVVLKKTKRNLFIANEIGDISSDGIWVEALPFRIIESCRIIDRINL